MNGNTQMEVHYIDTGFPYTATESFMDFFEGLTLNYTHSELMHDQVFFFFFTFSSFICGKKKGKNFPQ